MTTFTTEDRELAQKETIPFYGYCYLTDPSATKKNLPEKPVNKILNIEYRIDAGSEDIES